MSEFSCSGCNYVSDTKKSVERHINGKGSKCKDAEINEIEADINCEYCNKTFATRPSMKRHYKTCKIKKASMEEEIEKMKKKLAETEVKLAVAEAKASTTNNITNNIQTQNNIIIQITPYNDPNMDGVERYYKDAIKKLFMSVPTIIEKIHFNDEFPENHNICITNWRSKMAKVFNGREWKTMDEDRLINELVDTYERLLEDWAEEKPERMKYIENYKEIKRRDGASKVNKDLKDEVKKLIYDKRNMIKIKN
jgi:hypothetical protein